MIDALLLGLEEALFFGRVKTSNLVQGKYMQILYSVGLDLIWSTKNLRYLNLSGFPTKVEF